MKILVVGGGGLLGSSFQGENFLIVKRQDLDISNFSMLEKFCLKHPISHIINAAAFSMVDLAEERKEEAYLGNVVGPKNLAKIALKIGAKLIHLSTDYVFEGNVKRALHEEDETSPCNYYGETKLAGEKKVLEAMPEATIIRTSWIFGGRGKSFVAKLYHELLEKEELFLTDDQYGRPTYLFDLKEALLQMKDTPGLFHYASNGITSRYEFATTLKSMMEAQGFPVKTSMLHPVPASTFVTPAKRPLFSALDTTKIEKIIGPIRHWREGLNEHLLEKLACVP